MNYGFCNKLVPKAKNGKNRGKCDRLAGHNPPHANKTCYDCGKRLGPKNAFPAVALKGRGRCRDCSACYQRNLKGFKPRNYQCLGSIHIFPCGCKGMLPRELEKSNKFVRGSHSSFVCRVSEILNRRRIKKRGYHPINKDTPHFVIRKMMEDPNCKCCAKALKWEFGAGKTPHLHHNHETGELIGFTHSKCNPQAMQNEIDRLRDLLKAFRGNQE